MFKKYYQGLIPTYYNDGSFRGHTTVSKMLEGATFVWGDGRPIAKGVVTDIDKVNKVIKIKVEE